MDERHRPTPEEQALLQGRYTRQTLFQGLGEEGQLRLMRSRVVVAGCGALGSIQATLLARAGVGTLRVVDRDFVEEANLQRQVLFDEADAASFQPKATAAASRLRRANSAVKVEGIVDDINASTVDRLLGGFDLILDGTDNFATRFLINDFAVKHNVPWVYGACVGAYGLSFTIVPGETPCLRCLFEPPPQGTTPTCDTAGVIGPVAAVIASIQAAEALKLLAGKTGALSRRITFVDLWENTFEPADPPERQPECPCCGQRKFEYLEGGGRSLTISLCGRDAVQVIPATATKLDLDALGDRLAPVGRVRSTRHLLRAQIDEYVLTVFPDGRAIVNGTGDATVAKSLYARYVGA